MKIPFNKPYMTGSELDYVRQAHENGTLAGDGPFTRRCHQWLESNSGARRALLSHSCTAALEMSALLLNIEPGDEFIIPSYTFVSTANAFVLRGGVPVFVDIHADTLNLDESLINAAISSKTKAIVPVHYAGVGCEMDKVVAIAKSRGIAIVEDAAQGVMAKYKGRPLGSIGDFGTYSFHETKNVISGEGGALLVNNPSMVERAEVIREKGTDRSRFFRGQVDKYTWQEVGSSFLPGELIAAFLWAQLQHAREITDIRLAAWNRYHELFKNMEIAGTIRRPIVPLDCVHNAHMYYLLLPEDTDRSEVLQSMERDGVNAVFHYVPLHSSPAGKRLGKIGSDLSVTEDISQRLIRLPMWVGISEEEQMVVYNSVCRALS
ncbi:MAG: dTDP-4-amino-4,6-dideoxygalactose transaminase [Gammaproteobacteria bacterium]|nr:dTDP-4-amino-4,6-dideoxygalactose transaminase [Gammaproteobacteria bacterium]